MRTQRTDGYYTYHYIYNGSQLSQLTVVYDDGEHYEYHRLNFAYSADGTPLTVTYGGCTYYYVTNIQGDVIAILDDIGRLVCRYAYDAWGNVTICDERPDNVSWYNPLRYRGYVYDWETNLYYLQSRYYNPELGRFLNADALISTGQGVLGHNMFAYCNNNPVMGYDPYGMFALSGFAPTAITEIGKEIAKMASAYAGCGGLAIGDGLLPIGDILGVFGAIVLTVGAVGRGLYNASQTPYSPSVSQPIQDTISTGIESIARGFRIFECKQAVDAITDYLKKNKQHGEIITLMFDGNRGFVWSDIANKTISQNGIHMGVKYNGIVYCNVHPYGLPEALWINDFYGTGNKHVFRVRF